MSDIHSRRIWSLSTGKMLDECEVDMVTDEKLASTVSDKMVAAIPAALAERGISADIAKKYGKGAYFVLRVHVTELDKIKLLTTANAGDNADAALFAKLGLRPMESEEPMRMEAAE